MMQKERLQCLVQRVREVEMCAHDDRVFQHHGPIHRVGSQIAWKEGKLTQITMLNQAHVHLIAFLESDGLPRRALQVPRVLPGVRRGCISNINYRVSLDDSDYGTEARGTQMWRDHDIRTGERDPSCPEIDRVEVSEPRIILALVCDKGGRIVKRTKSTLIRRTSA